MNTELTDRQQRELDYHREHAKEHRWILDSPFSWEVLQDPGKRWWNAYWEMYAYLAECDLKGKSVLIVGCGFGHDALLIAKLGASVSAFDLSPDSLQIARELAIREGLQIAFDEMPAEHMRYEDSTFDYIIAQDILHHVDIPRTMGEIVRVAKPNAVLVVNEIYSHSVTDKIRRSSLVKKVLYPRMQRLIYGPGKPYITEDERKLSELDLMEIIKPLQSIQFEKHFNFLVTRVVPHRFELLCKVDRLLLRLLQPIGRLLAGRVLFSACVSKQHRANGE
ncbi:MAG: class I SAM-dependent methyltransferase [Acidobacteria bacterium]|nr:class I SAM-dependent methyltransferase [Acidobacteriota bacterium]